MISSLLTNYVLSLKGAPRLDQVRRGSSFKTLTIEKTPWKGWMRLLVQPALGGWSCVAGRWAFQKQRQLAGKGDQQEEPAGEPSPAC